MFLFGAEAVSKQQIFERIYIMENKTDTVKRGEIYYYDFGKNEGSIQNGLRPVLIIQCDDANKASTTTIENLSK